VRTTDANWVDAIAARGGLTAFDRHQFHVGVERFVGRVHPGKLRCLSATRDHMRPHEPPVVHAAAVPLFEGLGPALAPEGNYPGRVVANGVGDGRDFPLDHLGSTVCGCGHTC